MQHYDRPVIIRVNQLDHPHADFDSTVAQAKDHFGGAVTVMQYPVEQGEGFHRIIDLLKMRMYVFKDDGASRKKEPIPESEKERAEACTRNWSEKAAGERRGADGEILRAGRAHRGRDAAGPEAGHDGAHLLSGVLPERPARNMGSGRLMGFIDNVAPSALEMPPPLVDGGELPCQADGPAVIFTFKTINEPLAPAGSACSR